MEEDKIGKLLYRPTKDIRGGAEYLEENLRKAQLISLKERDILIWGAGNTTELDKSTIIHEGLCPKFFVDNDPEKQGRLMWNIEVIAPSEIKKRCTNPVILISTAYPEFCQAILAQMSAMGLTEHYMLDAVIWGRHIEELLEVYDLLETDASREYFASIILARMKGTQISKTSKNMHYFDMDGFGTVRSEEIFVDCGAYEGDTIEQYLEVKKAVFKEIYAFEPDHKNWNAMAEKIELLKQKWSLSEHQIHLVRGGVGKQDGEMFLIENKNGEAVKVWEDGTGETIHIYAIDSYLKNVNVGFLKADIEGCEMDMIMGAKNCIRKNKPRLAICIYHKSTDMYSIPLLLHSINKDYKLDIVHYGDIYVDTVLYAY